MIAANGCHTRTERSGLMKPATCSTFTKAMSVANIATTPQAFHAAYESDASAAETPIHHTRTRYRCLRGIPRLGCRDGGSDATAAVPNAAQSVSPANSGTRRAPMMIGNGYLAETTTSPSNATAAAAIAVATIAEVGSRARTCSAIRRAYPC